MHDGDTNLVHQVPLGVVVLRQRVAVHVLYGQQILQLKRKLTKDLLSGSQQTGKPGQKLNLVFSLKNRMIIINYW